MTRYKYVLCDIDGTLADLSHRLHHVRTKPKNWRAFFRELENDQVIAPVKQILYSLSITGMKVILLSGRGTEFKRPTESWLLEHNVPYDELHMRPERDYRGDEIVKKELFEARFPNASDREGILGIFDDRPKVIRMWRSIGLKVFDVGDGTEF